MMKNPWRRWDVFLGIAGNSALCGELCSLRFTWQRPKKSASSEQQFLEESFVRFLDLAQELAGTPLTNLHVEKVPGANNLFALAEFDRHVTAEFEMNEDLPDSMPDSFFIRANFTGGHLSSHPLAGHFSEAGSLLADDRELRRFTVISDHPEIAGGPVENLMRVCEIQGTPEMKNGEQLLDAVRKAVRR